MARPQIRARLSQRDRQRRADGQGRLLIAGVLLAIAGLVGGYWHIAGRQITVDAETLCPRDGPLGVTAVVVDRTDTVSPVQRELLMKAFAAIRDAVPRHGLLEVYTVDPVTTSVLKPAFSLCNPGTGAELSQWTANPRLARMTWATAFDQPLREVFDGMLEPARAARSPIMETIQSVAATAFAGRPDVPKQLIIASDLLQFSDAADHYRAPVPFAGFRGGPGYRAVKADLRGVAVRVLYIRRETAKGVQGAAHAQFWADYFIDQGAVAFAAEAIH